MAIEPSTFSVGGASRAYRSAQSVPIDRMAGNVAARGPSFSDMLENVSLRTVETIREGDRAAVSGLKGEMPMQQVIEAVAAMETSMKTAVAIRDKVVSAYQEVLRMAV